MNFDLTEEQAAMEQMAKNFAEKEIVPNLKKEEFNRELVRKMGKLGFSAAPFPKGWAGPPPASWPIRWSASRSPLMIRGCGLSSTSRP